LLSVLSIVGELTKAIAIDVCDLFADRPDS
jgi:hypothetical protein